MVDLHWIAARLIERERKHLPNPKGLPMSIKQVSVRMEFAGLNVDIELAVTTKDELVADIDLLYGLGFTKPIRYSKEGQEVTNQIAEVTGVTASEKKYNGKNMWDVALNGTDGKTYKVTKLNKSEFRVGDEVWLFKNDKGFADITLDIPNEELGGIGEPPF